MGLYSRNNERDPLEVAQVLMDQLEGQSVFMDIIQENRMLANNC